MSNDQGMSRYLILRQLGHGNLTRVFLATERLSGRMQPCVLKLMRPELSSDDDFRALFLDQAARTLGLRHPNLVRTRDVVADAEACGLTMEFLEGQTLARVLERVGRTRLPVDMHLHILSKVLRALEYAHAELARSGQPQLGFLHRDACPNNVFITYDGQVKLLGAGFADATRALESKLGRPLADVRYAAPEVLLGDPEGASVDVFGVGTMLWEAVARQVRVNGDDPSLIIERRVEGEEPELERVWPDAPLPVIEMCRRALTIDPRQRYENAAALRVDLDAYLGRASQASETVLERLAELMKSHFAAEREQMQLFVGSSLESASQHPLLSPHELLDADEELTPEGAEWNAPTHANIQPPHLRVTGQLASPRAYTDASAPLAGSPRARASLPPAPERQPGSGSASDVPSQRELTTGGHRAYSTSLEVKGPRRRSGRHRRNPDVLGATALIIGSIVAAYSLHRYMQRDRRTESEQLAIQAEARVPAPSARLNPRGAADSAPPSQSTGVHVRRDDPERSDEPALAPVTARRFSGNAAGNTAGSADAGAGAGEEHAASSPAFFDGKAASPSTREKATPLEAEDLPAVDPALSSLQEAILNHARAHQLALKHKRERDKKADMPPPAPNAEGPTQQSPVDDVRVPSTSGSE